MSRKRFTLLGAAATALAVNSFRDGPNLNHFKVYAESPNLPSQKTQSAAKTSRQQLLDTLETKFGRDVKKELSDILDFQEVYGGNTGYKELLTVFFNRAEVMNFLYAVKSRMPEDVAGRVRNIENILRDSEDENGKKDPDAAASVITKMTSIVKRTDTDDEKREALMNIGRILKFASAAPYAPAVKCFADLVLQKPERANGFLNFVMTAKNTQDGDKTTNNKFNKEVFKACKNELNNAEIK